MTIIKLSLQKIKHCCYYAADSWLALLAHFAWAPIDQRLSTKYIDTMAKHAFNLQGWIAKTVFWQRRINAKGISADLGISLAPATRELKRFVTEFNDGLEEHAKGHWYVYPRPDFDPSPLYDPLNDLCSPAMVTFERSFQSPVGEPTIIARPSIPVLSRMIHAIVNAQDLLITYQSLGKAASHRRVTPKSVTGSLGRVYLSAYCHTRKDWRAFNLDRISAIEIKQATSQSLPPEPKVTLSIQANPHLGGEEQSLLEHTLTQSRYVMDTTKAFMFNTGNGINPTIATRSIESQFPSLYPYVVHDMCESADNRKT